MKRTAWIAAFIVVAGVWCVWRSATSEGFDSPAQSAIAANVVKDVIAGKVQPAPGSVQRVALTSMETAPPQLSNGFSQLLFNQPAATQKLRVRPKYVMNDVQIIGRPFTVEGSGSSKAGAEADARRKALQGVNEINSVLRANRLMN